MLLSIIIPFYERHRSILKTLESLNRQTAKNFSVQIVDDGSSTPLKIDERDYSFPVAVFRQPNKGVASARNSGAEISWSDYLIFLDAGDEYDPTFTKTIQKQIYETQSSEHFFATGFKTIRDDKYTHSKNDSNNHSESHRISYEEYLNLCVLGEQLLHLCSCCFSREIFIRTGGFREGETHGEDHEFLLRALKTSKSLIYSNERLFFYIIDDSESITRSRKPSPTYAHTKLYLGNDNLTPSECNYLVTTIVENFLENCRKKNYRTAFFNLKNTLHKNGIKLFLVFLFKRVYLSLKRTVQIR